MKLDHFFASIQVAFIAMLGLTLDDMQKIVIIISSIATFWIYFIINFDKIKAFFKRKT